MTVQELVQEVEKHMLESDLADKSGHPETMKSNLVSARILITEFLGDSDAVDEKPAEKEETKQTTGHCQPDQTHEAGSE